MGDSHHLTLHVIDIRRCQVMTLMEESRPGADDGIHFDGPQFEHIGTAAHGFELPKLFGLPPLGSPYYRNLTDEDYRNIVWSGVDDDSYLRQVEYFSLWGGLKLLVADVARSGYLSFYSPQDADEDALHFNFGACDFSTIYRRLDVCSYLCALMKEKCAKGEVTEMPLLNLQQPVWIDTDVILDKVLSYVSFGDQAGKLRLVCRQFGESALRLLNTKLDGFVKGSREFGGARFSRGWSTQHLTSKESAADDAIWLASCRCSDKSSCKDKDSCPFANKPLQYSDRHTDEPKILDTTLAREQLIERCDSSLKYGWLDLKERDPREPINDYGEPSNQIKCSFECKEMNRFVICDKIERDMHEKMDYDGLMEGESFSLGGPFGVTLKHFLRSIFILFARKNDGNANGSEVAAKKARKSSIEEVTIGMAKSNIVFTSNRYLRMRKIYRFYTAAHEPVEICLDYRRSFDY